MLCLILFNLFSCHKKQKRYPEDPKSTRCAPEDRFNGSWKITDYTFKGSSIYNELNKQSKGNTNLDNVVIIYSKKTSETNDQEIFQISNFPQNNYSSSFSSVNLRFTPDNNCLCGLQDSLFSYWFIAPFKYNHSLTTDWTITKLYKNDCNVVLQTDSGEFKIFLNKIN